MDGRAKEVFPLKASSRAALVKEAEAEVLSARKSGRWSLYGADGQRIKAGKFIAGEWVTRGAGHARKIGRKVGRKVRNKNHPR